MRNIVLLIVALVTFSFSYSQEWEFIEGDEVKEIYIRMESKNTAWVKMIALDGYLDDEMVYKEAKYLIKFDCKKKKTGSLAEIYYDKNHDVVDSINNEDYEVIMEYVFPDSKGESILKYFCERQ